MNANLVAYHFHQFKKKHNQTIRHNDHKCEASGKLFSQVGHLRLHIHTVNKGAVIRQQM